MRQDFQVESSRRSNAGRTDGLDMARRFPRGNSSVVVGVKRTTTVTNGRRERSCVSQESTQKERNCVFYEERKPPRTLSQARSFKMGLGIDSRAHRPESWKNVELSVD